MALKYLKDTEVNINNIFIITGDFNIRNSSWNPNFPHHSIYRDTLIDIADSFLLELSKPTNCIPTRYSDNQYDLNLVIDLLFFRLGSLEHDNHSIYLDWHLISNYIPLTVNIVIFEEFIQSKRCTLVKNSKEEDKFIVELIEATKRLNMENIQSKEVLEHIVQTFTECTEQIWYKNSKIINITKYSKAWWDENCHRDLDDYRHSKRIEDWK